MKLSRSERGFPILTHPDYPEGVEKRLSQESSIVGDYDDSLDKPGSSALWIGDDHHLNREEVHELIGHLQHWLDHGSFMTRPE